MIGSLEHLVADPLDQHALLEPDRPTELDVGHLVLLHEAVERSAAHTEEGSGFGDSEHGDLRVTYALALET